MSFVEGVGSEVEITFLLGFFILTVLMYIMKKRAQAPQEEIANNVNEEVPPPVFNIGSCPICLNSPTFGIETNCGHLHCGDCFIHYHGLYFNGEPLNCPFCRQRVSLLFLCFTNDERISEANIAITQRISRFVRRYNGTMTNDVTLLERIREIPILLRHCIQRLIDGETFLDTWIRIKIFMYIVFVIMYILVPYDLIPEFAYGFLGYIDDVLLLLFFLLYFVGLYRHFIANLE